MLEHKLDTHVLTQKDNRFLDCEDDSHCE